MVIGNRLGSQKAANLRNASKHLLISVLPQDKQEKKRREGEKREKRRQGVVYRRAWREEGEGRNDAIYIIISEIKLKQQKLVHLQPP